MISGVIIEQICCIILETHSGKKIVEIFVFFRTDLISKTNKGQIKCFLSHIFWPLTIWDSYCDVVKILRDHRQIKSMCPQNDNDMTHVQKFALKAILLSFETNEVLRRVFKLQAVILWASQLCGPEIEQHRLSASSMSSKQICVWINLKLDGGNLIVSIFGYWRDCQITLLRRPNDLLDNRNRTKSDSKRLYSFIQPTWLLLLFCTTFLVCCRASWRL